MTSHALTKIHLDEKITNFKSEIITNERDVAIYDLLEENYFKPLHPHADTIPSYELYLRIQERNLIFDIKSNTGQDLLKILLSLNPFRRIVKDYFIICESYYEAVKNANHAQLEAIDMGRRGLHNEGSELLREQLNGKVELDHNTARRLFTLICVLHFKGNTM